MLFFFKRTLPATVLIVILFCVPSRAGFMDLSVQEEKELGKKFYILLQSHYNIIKDPVITKYIRDLSSRLKKTLPPQPYPVRVNLIQDNSMNAFAAPAGYVYLYSGLILKMQSESELAAIMAHEFGHVEHRHIAANLERSKYINIGTVLGVLAGALVGSQAQALGKAISMGSMAGGRAAALKYTRDQEREADRTGLIYLVKAGYNKYGMYKSFKRIKQENLFSGTETPPDYMLTHPGLDTRINYIRNMVNQLKISGNRTWEPNKQRLQKVQMLLRSKYSPVDMARSYYEPGLDKLSCLEVLGKGILLERMNQIQKARSCFQKAVESPEYDYLSQREFGRFCFKLGEFDKAYRHLKKALQLNPKGRLALYYKAKVLAERGKISRAVQDLKRVVSSLPRDASVHYTLGMLLGRNGNKFAGFLHYAYTEMFLNKKKRTQYYSQKARSLAETPEQKNKLQAFEKKYKIRKKYW